MSIVTYVFAIVASLATLALVIWLLRRGRLRERHAIWWIVAATLALIVSVFPSTLAWASQLLGFNLGSNLVYFVSIAVLFLVCIQHSAELTRVEAQVRRLAEEVALLRMELDAADGSGAPARDEGNVG
jgi:hypothetical protein